MPFPSIICWSYIDTLVSGTSIIQKSRLVDAFALLLAILLRCAMMGKECHGRAENVIFVSCDIE